MDCERICGHCGTVQIVKDCCGSGPHYFTCGFCEEEKAYERYTA